MLKKGAKHLFLKIIFICSLLLLLTPETLPNHLFRQTNDQKSSKKLPKRTKINFLFFKIFHIFLLSLRKKTKPLTFFTLFITGNRKTARENVPYKIFFSCSFFFLLFLHPTAPRKRKNYHLPFFRNSDLKCPKMPLRALKFHILQITFFPPGLRGHIHLPKHTPFFLTTMLKKRA